MRRTPLLRTQSLKRSPINKVGKSTKKIYRGGAAPTDKHIHDLWAKVVKAQDGHECRLFGCGNMKCGGVLNAHHIMSTRHRATKADPENGLTLCSIHHLHYVHRDTTKAAMDILEVIGQERYDRLETKHREETRWFAEDRHRIYAELKAMLEELK